VPHLALALQKKRLLIVLQDLQIAVDIWFVTIDFESPFSNIITSSIINQISFRELLGFVFLYFNGAASVGLVRCLYSWFPQTFHLDETAVGIYS